MILITGAAGFIGSVLAKELSDAGEKLFLIDDVDNTKLKNIEDIKYEKLISIHEMWELTDDVWQSFSKIFHMGACSSTTERNWNYLKENNIEYSQKIFQKASQFQIPLVYASSAATYGAGEKGYDDDHSKMSELCPLNFYGKSKQEMDLWVLEQEKTPPIWFGLKFFNVYGPRESHKHEMRSLVNKGHQQILESGKVKLFKSHKEGFEDGKQLRDFIYVKDVTRAMRELIETSNPIYSGIYNLGTGCARSFYDLIVATFVAMDREVNIEFIPMPLELRDQYQYFTEAKMEKFKKVLPEFKFHSLEEGVNDYVRKYLNK
ncbi:MAG: ADP-glyceromanno-heptose 6-epimerase [Halobacteriovoraceae bacterium]|nr:ADP-glyceromanno-heptose 6-epimerase [Halobacteriovoraceae bacterium]